MEELLMNRKKKPSPSDFPSIYWERFFGKFKEIDTLQVSEWKVVHLLGYFCSLYEKQYGVSYTFKFNSSAPTKSYEVFRLHSLMHMISSDPVIIKDYFDWFFETKIIPRNRKITSLALIVETNSANEYKFKRLAMDKNQTIGRTTLLPPQYASIASLLNIDCKTYGDLAFILKLSKSDDDRQYLQLLSQLELAGLDLKVLDKVI